MDNVAGALVAPPLALGYERKEHGMNPAFEAPGSIVNLLIRGERRVG